MLLDTYDRALVNLDRLAQQSPENKQIVIDILEDLSKFIEDVKNEL